MEKKNVARKQSSLKRIQKTAFASNSVHARSLNIGDLAKKINFKGWEKAFRLPLSLLSAHLQVSQTVVWLFKTENQDRK